MIDYASLEAVSARLRSSRWDTGELANALAVAIASVAKQPTFKRGLHDDVIAGVEGGTTLSATDNSAGRQSVGLQIPQRMFMMKHGSIATRMQARVDIDTRTVPAKVLSVDGTGPDAVMTVAVAGTKPLTTWDSIAQSKVPTDPLSDLAQDSSYLEQNGVVKEVTLSGLSFQTGDEAGTKLPEVGQTIMVTLASQQEKRTIWVNHRGVNSPRVFSVPESEVVPTVTAVNGLCCKDTTGGGGGT